MLGRDGAAGLDAGQAFADSGFNSLSAVELRNRLTAVTAVTLPATAIFDHPTPTELAQYLITQIDGHGSSAAAAANPAERIDALTDLFYKLAMRVGMPMVGRWSPWRRIRASA